MARSTNELLEIPEQFLRILLPNERLSIARFFDYPLPVITATVSDCSLKDFFDTAAPFEHINLSQLVKQPLPSPHTVKKLVEDLPNQVLSGKQSITCPDDGIFGLKRLPFWVLGYWVKVIEHRKILSEWLIAENWVRNLLSRSKNDEDRDIIREVLKMFTLLPWSGKLRGVDWTMSIQDLSTFLGTKWLSTNHMDLLLHATKRRLSRKYDVLQQYQLQELAFINKLISAHRTDGKIPNHMHRIAAEIASGQCRGVGGFANVNGNHWISWAVSNDWILYYGDGNIHSEVDKTVEAVLRWWLQPYSHQEIKLQKMDISSQQDSYSCGILSDNSLEHFFSSDIVLVTQTGIPLLRCKAFLEYAQRYLAMV